MEKKSLLSTNWLKAAFLLVAFCFSGLFAHANTTETLPLGKLVSGQTYEIPANTSVTATFGASYDGTITLTSSVNANTNLVPFADEALTQVISSERDEQARTKTFAIQRNTPIYFGNTISATPYEVTFVYERASNFEDYFSSITPAVGEEVNSLKEFVVEFSTKLYGAYGKVYLYKGEEIVAEKELVAAYNTTTYTITFDNEITEAGDYTLVFPENVFTIGMGMQGNSEWRFDYTVVAPQPKMNVSIVGGATEAEAVTFNNLNGKVTFENTTATIASEWTYFGIWGSLAGAPAGSGTWYVHYTATKVSDTEYTLTPNADQLASLPANTAYLFKIPEGYFTYADGSKSPAYETWVKYEAPQTSDVTIAFSPVGGSEDAPAQVALEDFSNITLTLTGAESVAVSTAAVTEDSAISLRIWDDNWAEYVDAVKFKPELVEGTTYKLVAFDEYNEANIPLLSSGKYELKIPAGTFVYNGEETNVNLTTTTYYNLVLPTYTILPEPDSTIEATETEGLVQVQIRFNNEASVTPSQTVTASLKKDGVVVEEGIFAQKNWAKQNMAIIWFSKTYTESGEYELVLPEGYVTLGSGAAAEAMTIKYTVVGPASTEPALVVTPEGGTEDAPATLTSFEFVVNAENATKLDYNESGWIALNGWGEGRNGEGYVNALWPTFTRVDDTTVKLTIEGYTVEELLEQTVDGKFQLSIPAGDMWFNGDETQKCEDLTLYYVYESSAEPEMIIYPAKGDVVGEIADGTFIIEFKNVENVAVSNDGTSDYSANGIQLMGTGNDQGWVINYLKVEPIEGETNKYRLISRPNQSVGANARYKEFPITEEGTYGLYIPYGLFTYDGQSTYLYEEQYLTVGKVVEAAMIITPENGAEIESYKDIKISFEGVTTVEINSSALNPEMGKVMLVADDDWMNSAVAMPVAVEGETNVFELEVIDGQLPESYKSLLFYMEEGTFYMDGVDSPGVEYTYTVKSVGVEPTMILTPEAGTVVKSVTSDLITISFENADEVAINSAMLDFNNDPLCILIDPNDTWISVYPVAVEGETNKFNLVPFDGQPVYPYTTEGEYGLWIPDGTFIVNGAEFAGVYEEKYITVSSDVKPEMVITPEAGTTVKAITSDVVTISFENVNEVTVNSGALTEASCKIMFMTPDGGYHRVMPVAIEGESNKFRLVNFDGSDFNLTTEGTYGLWLIGDFPQPAFYMDGSPCPSYYEVNYITVSPYTYVADPAEGYVSSIKEVALTFDPGVQGMNEDAAGDVVLYKDGEEVEKVSVDNLSLVGWDALGSSLVITFSKEYTEKGEYQVVVPANVVELNGGISNKEITLNYTIGGMVSNWTAVANPAPGVVDEISTVWVEFEGASQIAVSSDIGPNDFPYYGTVAEDGTVTKVPYGIFSFVESSTEVSLTIQNEAGKITEPGKYAIIIPAAYCTVDGVALTEDIRFDYTIEGAQPEYTAVINPADGSTVKGEQLYVITVTFEGAKSIELDGNLATTFNQIDENGNAVTSIYQTQSVEGNVATFTVMELHKPYLDAAGTFRFTIPVGMVIITDNNDVVGKNKDNIVATYDSEGTSVDTIGVDAKDLNIYSVNGMLIKRNGTYEDVKALERGVYIINGKKYYVK